MNEWMNEWINKWMNDWIKIWVSEWINVWMVEWINKKWMNEWMNCFRWMLQCLSSNEVKCVKKKQRNLFWIVQPYP